jgi:hypothetical protein
MPSRVANTTFPGLGSPDAATSPPHVLGLKAPVARRALLAATLALGLVAGGAAFADEPEVTDENVEAAIQRAAAWIEARRSSAGHWETGTDLKERHWAGDSALALLSLLYAGRDPREAALADSLDWLGAQTLNGTYVYGVRAHALALVPGRKYRPRLQEDLDWLLKAVGPRGTDAAGAYNYTPIEPGRAGRWDNSVSQFGVLGVWMAADAGLSVPDSYWEIVGEHWLQTQNTDGGWGYQGHNSVSTGSMTAAGLAALFVVLDQRYAERPREAGGLLTALELGLTWFGREYGPDNPHGEPEWRYYYLYGVERVGAASGHKYFRSQDWFRGAASHLLKTQKADGSWPGTGGYMSDLRNTAFALMVLCHGRAPLLFNKLEHGEDWNAKLRDVAGLTRYASRMLERILNWQIVRLDGPLEDLLEAPVLYVYGEAKREFNEVEIQKIREFCQRGGLVFAVAGKNSDEFIRSFETLAARALPEYRVRPLVRDHPLFNGEVQFEIKDPPPMRQVHNGVRTLMLLAERDLAAAWNRQQPRGSLEQDFQLAANVYLYATDKHTMRSRLQVPAIPERGVSPERTLRLARLKYDGPWDPEPYGWTRLAAYLKNEAGTRLLVSTGVTLDSPELREFTVAHITGTTRFELTPAELRGLRQFLSAGGTLLADPAGGAPEFIRALEEQVGQAMSGEPHVLPTDSAVLTGAGVPGAVDLASVAYRRAARTAARGQNYPLLRAFLSARRPAVIYTPLDLSAGLLGTQAYDVRGYEPDSALRIMRNLLLYAGLSSADKARLERNE